ncbi:MAG TPA: alpha-glycosidase, partial [Romboutsia timonensis]|nr:alpha-glycosidase [Romboutsia timonensis]
MQTIECGFNLIGSHDTTRVLSYCNNNKDKFKLAYLFMFTQSGSPCIYYGDEVGMTGVQTKDCEGQRECMVWDEDKQDKDILEFMKKIISLRKKYDEFKLVNNEWVLTEDNVIIVKKEEVSIIINNNDLEKTIELPHYLKDKKVYDVFNEDYIDLKSKLILNPYKYLIIKN